VVGDLTSPIATEAFGVNVMLKRGVSWMALPLGVCAVVGLVYRAQKPERDARAVYFDVVVKIKNGVCGYTSEEGFWTGDVAGLCELGVISREVAEADTAPLKPLVDRPRPYHGYFVVAMESSASSGGDWTQSDVLKGKRRGRNYGVCVYPAEDRRPDLPVYLVQPSGIYRKASEGNKPILQWPKDRSGWSIVD
jgi:hypothetical protein